MSDQHNYLTTLDVLHDLIQVNGLRVCGYQPIIENRSDAVSSPWYVLLDEIICQSRRWQDELEVQVVELTGDLPANRGGAASSCGCGTPINMPRRMRSNRWRPVSSARVNRRCSKFMNRPQNRSTRLWYARN